MTALVQKSVKIITSIGSTIGPKITRSGAVETRAWAAMGQTSHLFRPSSTGRLTVHLVILQPHQERSVPPRRESWLAVASRACSLSWPWAWLWDGGSERTTCRWSSPAAWGARVVPPSMERSLCCQKSLRALRKMPAKHDLFTHLRGTSGTSSAVLRESHMLCGMVQHTKCIVPWLSQICLSLRGCV